MSFVRLSLDDPGLLGRKICDVAVDFRIVAILHRVASHGACPTGKQSYDGTARAFDRITTTPPPKAGCRNLRSHSTGDTMNSHSYFDTIQGAGELRVLRATDLIRYTPQGQGDEFVGRNSSNLNEMRRNTSGQIMRLSHSQPRTTEPYAVHTELRWTTLYRSEF